MEFAGYLRFVLALLVVLGLIGLAAWGAKRLGLAGRLPLAGARGRRLGVVEVAALDPKHRLVLVRRDGVEHLLLLGPSGHAVVERAIPAAAAVEPDDEPQEATP